MTTFHQYCVNPEEASWDPERQKPLDRQGKRLSESVCSATLDREALRLADNARILTITVTVRFHFDLQLVAHTVQLLQCFYLLG